MDLSAGYASGQSIQVFVNERDSQRSTLYPDDHRVFWFVVAFGMGMLALALRPRLQ